MPKRAIIIIIVLAYVFPCLHGLDVSHSTNSAHFTILYPLYLQRTHIHITLHTQSTLSSLFHSILPLQQPSIYRQTPNHSHSSFPHVQTTEASLSSSHQPPPLYPIVCTALCSQFHFPVLLHKIGRAHV